MDGIFLVIIGIRFGKEYKKNSLFRKIFLPYWGIRLDMPDELLYRELYYFLIGEIWLDLQDNILLGIILFPLSLGDFP